MSSLALAARNGAFAAIGLYLIIASVLLVLSYTSLQGNRPLTQPGPLHSLASHLPALLGALPRQG